MGVTPLNLILDRIREQGGPFAEPLIRRDMIHREGRRPKSIWLARLDVPRDGHSYLVVLDRLGNPVYWYWDWDGAAKQVDTIPEEYLISDVWEIFDWNIECMPDNKQLGPWYDQNGYRQ